MKTIYTGMILVLVIVAVAYFISISGVMPTATLTIAVKDARQSRYGTINSLVLTFSEVSVHRVSPTEKINTTTEEINATESNETETFGWIKVVEETQMVDLMQFTDVSKVLGQKVLDAGKYTQIKLKIDSGTVNIDGTGYELIVPSKVLKLNRGFVLEPDAELKLILDFNVEKSLVSTGNNKFKLQPVIAVISEIGPTTTVPLTTTIITTQPTTTVTPTTTQTTSIPTTMQGILVMKIKDKLDLTNITAITITVDKVEVHKSGNGNDVSSDETLETNDTSSAGWTTIVDETKSYNLLELVDTPGEVMGNKTLSAGKYTQIRLAVSKAELTINNITYDVKVPSKRFYWIKPFDIQADKITTLTLDFDSDDSIVETGSNKFILKPVVKILTKITPITTTTTTSTTTSINTTSTTTSTSTTTTEPTTSTTTIETTTTIPENTTTSTII